MLTEKLEYFSNFIYILQAPLLRRGWERILTGSISWLGFFCCEKIERLKFKSSGSKLLSFGKVRVGKNYCNP